MHTKGTWITGKQDSCEKSDIFTEDRAVFIADCEGSRQGIDLHFSECEANARHICRCVNSHDALLVACKAFVENFHTSEDMVGAYQLAKAAIAESED